MEIETCTALLLHEFSDYWLRTTAEIHVIWRELEGMGTGCLFQFTYCDSAGA